MSNSKFVAKQTRRAAYVAAFLSATVFYTNGGPALALENGLPAITATTDCRHYNPGVFGASADCEIAKNKFLHAEGKKLEKELQGINSKNTLLERQNACFSKLKSDIAAIKSSRPLTSLEKSRFRMEVTKCDRIASM